MSSAVQTESSHGGAAVLQRAFRGGSYLFLQKLVTFAINSFVLRKLRLSITGAVTVQLELALATIFFLRDGVRLAFLRMPTLEQAPQATQEKPRNSSATSSSRVYVQQLVNSAWLSTAASLAVATGIAGLAWHAHYQQQSAGEVDTDLAAYPLVLGLYALAASIEALAEPLYVLAHCSVLVSWQVSAQGAAFLVRGVVQYVCIFVLDLGLLSYGLAEIAYASTLGLVLFSFFARRIVGQSELSCFALTSLRQLLPQWPHGSAPRWFHPSIISLLTPLAMQSCVKYLLSEGDKWVLACFTTYETMGVYGIVFHLGSLVPRIVFLPIEEATKTIFSKMGAAKAHEDTDIDAKKKKAQENDDEDARQLVLLLLKTMHLIGLVFTCFGTNYAATLTELLYGVEKARMGVSQALAIYCVYIYFLGLNGICEAFVHAVGDAKQLMALNKLMGVFFVIYAMASASFLGLLQLGTTGIILANCVNMGCRILYCGAFMATYFTNSSDSTAKSTVLSRVWALVAFWRSSLPNIAVLSAFGASFVVTAISRRAFLANGKDDSWRNHVVHVAVGGLCFVVTLLVLYAKERASIKKQVAAISRKPPQPKGKTHED